MPANNSKSNMRPVDTEEQSVFGKLPQLDSFDSDKPI